MNTFKEDLKVPLDKVQRKWLRRSATTVLVPLLIIGCLLYGLFDAIVYTWGATILFVKECW